MSYEVLFSMDNQMVTSEIHFEENKSENIEKFRAMGRSLFPNDLAIELALCSDWLDCFSLIFFIQSQKGPFPFRESDLTPKADHNLLWPFPRAFCGDFPRFPISDQSMTQRFGWDTR